MDEIVKHVFKKFLERWFAPKEEEWMAAFKSGKKFSDYRWGLLWVSATDPESCGFWAWKAWLMNCAIIAVILFLLGKRS